MVSTAMLAHLRLDDPSWVGWGAIGQWAGALATFAAVVVALWLPRRERRARQAAQARLVTIRVVYGLTVGTQRVTITNHSQQPVLDPLVVSLGDPSPGVRWGAQLADVVRPCDVLLPNNRHRVHFQHFDDHDQAVPLIDPDNPPTSKIEKLVDEGDVTIVFVDVDGVMWKRTGYGEPVRMTTLSGS
jgi:hypothetical protein